MHVCGVYQQLFIGAVGSPWEAVLDKRVLPRALQLRHSLFPSHAAEEPSDSTFPSAVEGPHSQNCEKASFPRPAYPAHVLPPSFLGSQPILLELARAAWLSPCSWLLPTLPSGLCPPGGAPSVGRPLGQEPRPRGHRHRVSSLSCSIPCALSLGCRWKDLSAGSGLGAKQLCGSARL